MFLNKLSIILSFSCQVLLLADNSQDSDIYPETDNLEMKASSKSILESSTDNSPLKEENFRSFSRVFDLEAEDLRSSQETETRLSPFEGRFPINIGITGYVATTGETLNIADAYQDPRFDPSVDDDNPSGFKHKSILCMPIRNASRKIIGVSQLINKLNGRPFNKNDENLFEVSFYEELLLLYYYLNLFEVSFYQHLVLLYYSLNLFLFCK
jgi:GAF domain-containing protein